MGAILHNFNSFVLNRGLRLLISYFFNYVILQNVIGFYIPPITSGCIPSIYGISIQRCMEWTENSLKPSQESNLIIKQHKTNPSEDFLKRRIARFLNLDIEFTLQLNIRRGRAVIVISRIVL